MNPFFAAWDALRDAIAGSLSGIHGWLEPLFGVHAWGWAIILLTIFIRVLLLPLAIKQTRSMRAMQALQPRVKAIQKKHKADRDLMRRDPQAYRERRQKMNEEMMALYREEGVNPAAGCLPLVLQAPIFFALFQVLRNPDDFVTGGHVADAPFYVFGPLSEAASADPGGWALVVLMAGSMFWSQRQMLSRNPVTEGPQAQQQKVIQYVMPIFLAFISLGLPIGVLLYWVTTNGWQVGQQTVILREVRAHPSTPEGTGGGDGRARDRRGRKATGGGRAQGAAERRSKAGRGGSAGAARGRGSAAGDGEKAKRNGTPRPEHLPRRRGGRTK